MREREKEKEGETMVVINRYATVLGFTTIIAIKGKVSF